MFRTAESHIPMKKYRTDWHILGGQVKTLPGSGHGTGSTSIDKKGLEPVSSLSLSVRVTVESRHSGQFILRIEIGRRTVHTLPLSV